MSLAKILLRIPDEVVFAGDVTEVICFALVFDGEFRFGWIKFHLTDRIDDFARRHGLLATAS